MRSIFAVSKPVPTGATRDELGADTDLDRLPSRQVVVACVKSQRLARDARLAVLHLGRQHVHAGRADEVADEGVRRLVEQFLRRASLHHAAVVHHDDGIGEGQRLGLIMRHIDHRQIERAVQRL